MRALKSSPFSVVFLSLVFGVLLTVMPLPNSLLWWRPPWLLIILFFWVLVSPAFYGVGFAWMVGILMDMLMGVSFGQHALVFVLLTYVMIKFHTVFFHSPRFQQALLIGLLALFSVLLQGMVSHMLSQPTNVSHHLLSVLTTVLVWPVVIALIESMQPRRYHL